jgi:hypothetical protein
MGMWLGATTVENSMVVPKKLKVKPLFIECNPTSEKEFKGDSQRDICRPGMGAWPVMLRQEDPQGQGQLWLHSEPLSQTQTGTGTFENTHSRLAEWLKYRVPA